jgi:hypothetical protein
LAAVALVTAGTVLLGVLVGAYLFNGDDAVWDPLGSFFSPQVVLDTTVDYDDAEIVVSGRVWMDGHPIDKGVKCAKEPVTTRSRYVWVSRQPVGTSILGFDGTGQFKPGCRVYADYRNPVPPQVLTRVRALCSIGYGPSTWRLSGSDTPVRGHDDDGRAHYWQTVDFTIGCP